MFRKRETGDENAAWLKGKGKDLACLVLPSKAMASVAREISFAWDHSPATCLSCLPDVRSRGLFIPYLQPKASGWPRLGNNSRSE